MANACLYGPVLQGQVRASLAGFDIGLHRAVTTEHAKSQLDRTSLVAEKAAATTTFDRDRASSVWLRIIDAIRQPMLVLDPSLCVLFANRAFYCQFNVRPEQMAGRDISAAGDHLLDVPALGAFVALIHSGVSVIENHEIEVLVPGLGTHVLLLSATREGECRHGYPEVVVTIDDVTERRHAESESRSARWRAERARLRQARFLAAASHDLRQPLQSLALMRAILSKHVKSGDVEQASRLIVQLNETADGMAGVLDTLLDLNQLEEGVIHPEKRAFPIDTLFEKLGEEFAHHAQARGLEWKMVRCGLKVWSDPHLLEQILRNLLSNAIKYTTAGRVLLGCRRRGDKLRIEVWDSGVGIIRSRIPTIFRQFERIDNCAGDARREVGLGLAIVRRLSDLLGHIVYVHSTPGSGSVFALEVPVTGGVSGFAISHKPRADAHAPGRPVTILIAESDPGVRDALDQLFTGEGYRTLSAADGEQARALALGAHHPDIIVAGYQFPTGPNGLRAVEQVRECVGHGTPAVVLTGHLTIDAMREIAMHGCVQRTKPTQADDLVLLIRSLLSAPKQSNPQPTVPAQGPDVGSQPQLPTIFVVDDDSSVRSAMEELLRDEPRWLIETYSSAEAFFKAFRSPREGVLLVDAQMPGMDGVDLLESLQTEHKELPAIMISGHADIRLAVRAMKAGAAAFLEKPVLYEELVGAIEQALERSRNSATRATWRESAANCLSKLTTREHQVLELVLEGKANKLIAHALGISQRTVETHRATVMKKTGARSLSELVHLTIAGSPSQPMRTG